MNYMFWVWLGVFVVTFIMEMGTAELVSIWFTIASIVPLILSAVQAVSWEFQLVIFIVLSAILILSLRSVTKKFLFRKLTDKTNTDALIGKKFHLLSGTDFETFGTVKIYGVTWNAVEKEGKKIESGHLVEVVGVEGNKLIVVEVDSAEKTCETPALNAENQDEKEEQEAEENSEEEQQSEKTSEGSKIKEAKTSKKSTSSVSKKNKKIEENKEAK